MLCKIVDHKKTKEDVLPLFGKGKDTWYKLIHHEDEPLGQYSLMKSYMDDNERCYAEAFIQDFEAAHLLSGHALVVDEDIIKADKRSKMYRDYQ